ncbi:glycosyl transferase 2 family protein [Mycobacterium xenopi 3993]|nr:glycosyl transferase 2 family protein [Mycobacterium xenopi 3993]
MGYPDVWIVVPAFNEAAVIGEVIADVRSVFDHAVCVDDGSTDGTGEIALGPGRTWCAIRSTWARGLRSRPVWSMPAVSPAHRSSPRSTATASTVSKTWSPWSTGSAPVTSTSSSEPASAGAAATGRHC